MLGWFQSPLTLADVETQNRRHTPAAAVTTAQLRRRADHWEIFVECRRPSRSAGSDAAAGGVPPAAQDWRDMRGVEAVSILCGPNEEAAVVLSVPERGEHRLFRGNSYGTLEVHRRSYLDRWYCRIVLPEEWLMPENPDAPMQVWFGCVRTHGDSMSMETAPFTGVPWWQEPGRVHVRLNRWTQLP
jgi:hypothetical protein